MRPTPRQIRLAAEAIANARGMRRGAPAFANVWDVLTPKLRDEVLEDAEAALRAAAAEDDDETAAAGKEGGAGEQVAKATLIERGADDLNAMRELERTMSQDEKRQYGRLLVEFIPKGTFVWEASAAVRAEAFERVKNPWRLVDEGGEPL